MPARGGVYYNSDRATITVDGEAVDTQHATFNDAGQTSPETSMYDLGGGQNTLTGRQQNGSMTVGVIITDIANDLYSRLQVHQNNQTGFPLVITVSSGSAGVGPKVWTYTDCKVTGLPGPVLDASSNNGLIVDATITYASRA